ncbi:MAG: YbjN domain-containing protein [Bacteroidetes bacterium]|nr:YbjN domain-containing protein [Bacteroidota bacterium]
MNLQQITPLIEKSLEGLKLDVATCRGANPGQWSFKQKDASVWIDVFNFPANPDKYYFQVMSPLCAVPDKNTEAFFQDLLEINYKMYGSWMCKKENWLYILSLREAVGLDQSEIDATLDRVGFYSSDYYSKLSFKYEGCWLPKPPVNNSGSGAPPSGV